jgi:hypothetical protein
MEGISSQLTKVITFSGGSGSGENQVRARPIVGSGFCRVQYQDAHGVYLR